MMLRKKINALLRIIEIDIVDLNNSLRTREKSLEKLCYGYRTKKNYDRCSDSQAERHKIILMGKERTKHNHIIPKTIFSQLGWLKFLAYTVNK